MPHALAGGLSLQGATGASTSEAGIPILRDDFDRLSSYPVVDVLDVGWCQQGHFHCR